MIVMKSVERYLKENRGVYMKVNNKRLEKNDSKNINAIILLIYIYMPFITNILENTFSASPIVNYLMQGIIILYVMSAVHSASTTAESASAAA